MTEPRPLKLHDSSLISFTVKWEQGDVEFFFRTHMGIAKIFGKEFKSLNVPHETEWGPSISVNSATLEKNDETGLARLEIEMQTGDIIVMTASEIEVDIPEDPVSGP